MSASLSLAQTLTAAAPDLRHRAFEAYCEHKMQHTFVTHGLQQKAVPREWPSDASTIGYGYGWGWGPGPETLEGLIRSSSRTRTSTTTVISPLGSCNCIIACHRQTISLSHDFPMPEWRVDCGSAVFSGPSCSNAKRRHLSYDMALCARALTPINHSDRYTRAPRKRRLAITLNWLQCTPTVLTAQQGQPLDIKIDMPARSLQHPEGTHIHTGAGGAYLTALPPMRRSRSGNTARHDHDSCCAGCSPTYSYNKSRNK